MLAWNKNKNILLFTKYKHVDTLKLIVKMISITTFTLKPKRNFEELQYTNTKTYHKTQKKLVSIIEEMIFHVKTCMIRRYNISYKASMSKLGYRKSPDCGKTEGEINEDHVKMKPKTPTYR